MSWDKTKHRSLKVGQEDVTVNVLVQPLLLDGAINMFLIYLTSVLKVNPLWAELVWFGQVLRCLTLEWRLYEGGNHLIWFFGPFDQDRNDTKWFIQSSQKEISPRLKRPGSPAETQSKACWFPDATAALRVQIQSNPSYTLDSTICVFVQVCNKKLKVV